jgi:hypothetical protein
MLILSEITGSSRSFRIFSSMVTTPPGSLPFFSRTSIVGWMVSPKNTGTRNRA